MRGFVFKWKGIAENWDKNILWSSSSFGGGCGSGQSEDRGEQFKSLLA